MHISFRHVVMAALAVSLLARAGASEESVSRVDRQIVNIAVADSGKLIVVQLSGEAALRIYDPIKKDFVGEVDTQAADCVFGAGGKSLVFYRPTDSVLESWDLHKLTRLESVEFLDPGPVLRIVMGSANGDEVFIRATSGSGALDRTVLQLFDVATLRAISRQSPGTTGHNSSFRDFVHYRADRFLTKISEWCTSHTPSGVGILVRRDRDFDQYYEHDSAGYLAMGDDGSIYAENGNVFSENPRPNRFQGQQDSLISRGSIPTAKPFPGIGGIFLLGVADDDSIQLYEMSSKKRIMDLGKLPLEFRPKKPDSEEAQNRRGRPQDFEQWTSTTFTMDKRIVFAPELGYLLFVPYSNDRIIVRTFSLDDAIRDLEGALYITSAPKTNAESGKEWQYELKALSSSSPVRFALAKAPQGMLMTDGGTATWAIPSGIRGDADVVVEAVDSAGNSETQRFTISFK